MSEFANSRRRATPCSARRELKKLLGLQSLSGIIYSITEIPVALMREIVDARIAELAGGYPLDSILPDDMKDAVMEHLTPILRRLATLPQTQQEPGFMEDEIRKLMADDGKPEDELETIPRMECQAFETHDYLVFMFHDLRDWMQVLQLMGVHEVDYSINRRTKKIGIGRVLHGKRLIEICRRASLAGTPPALPPIGDPVTQPEPLDHQSQAVSDGDAPRSRKRS